MDYVFQGKPSPFDDVPGPRPFTKEDVEVGALYTSTFHESAVIFSGNVSYQLIPDGLDLAIINRNLDSGQTQTLHLEDINFGSILAISNARINYYLEISIIDYIIEHRCSYGQRAFLEAGLRPFTLKQDKIVDAPNETRFMGQYAIDAKSRRVFNYIQEEIIYVGYRPTESTNTWKFCFNLTETPHRIVKWDDTEGILDLIRFAKEDIEISQIEFALTHPDAAAKRIEEIERYASLRDSFLTKEETKTMKTKIDRHIKSALGDDALEWRLSTNLLDPRLPLITNAAGDGEAYWSGFTVLGSLINREHVPANSSDQLTIKVRASFDEALAPFGFKTWVFIKLPTHKNRFIFFISKDSPNFREGLYYDIDLRGFGLSSNAWAQ